jgi:hypothetical protein
MGNAEVDDANESMIMANQGPSGLPAQQAEWDSERLQEAEKMLKEMYIRVCDLSNCPVL